MELTLTLRSGGQDVATHSERGFTTPSEAYSSIRRNVLALFEKATPGQRAEWGQIHITLSRNEPIHQLIPRGT